MDREQELACFTEKAMEKIKRSQDEIVQSLIRFQDEWKNVIMNAIKTLSDKIQKEEKILIAYLQFSVLRIDLLKEKKYHVVLTAYDPRWYLDDEAIEVSFEIHDWFQDRVKVWESLYALTEESMGKVTKYDVDHLMMNQIMEELPLTTHFLRFLLQDIEQEECFLQIPKSDIFQIRYGEYRDKSELILRMDHSLKDQKKWEKELRLTATVSDQLVYSGWYQVSITDSKAENLQLLYLRFEQSTLAKVSFQQSNLYGAKFLDCIINDCNFKKADLRCADFSRSKMEANDFTEADLEGAIFSEDVIPYLNLTSQQLQVIKIRGKSE